MNQSCFTLGFLSQNSLWKLSFICGYKEYLYWSERRMWNVRFFQNRGGSRLGLATWLSREFQSRDNRMTSCPVLSCSTPASMTVHLLACLARVLRLAAWSREPPASLCFLAHSWAINTLSHSLPLQQTHLNTGLLKVQKTCINTLERLDPQIQNNQFKLVRLNLINHLVGFIPCQICLYFSI